MSASSRSSRHRLPPQRSGGHRVALIGGLAIALAGGGWVAAAHAADAGATNAVAFVEGSTFDGAVADPQFPVYRTGYSPGSLSISAHVALLADGTRPPTAAQLAQTVRLRAAATARANQIAAAKAKAAAAAKAKAKAAAKARAVARARAAAAAARAAQLKAAAKKSPAKKPVAVYRGDITRSPAAMHSSRARAAIPMSVWRASATARHVVRAESGGNCRDVSASGTYRGCWQMTQGLWQGHGGRAFAARPELASCAQQDIVAYRIWVEQGWSPWSTA